jgi:hypothetical protein
MLRGLLLPCRLLFIAVPQSTTKYARPPGISIAVAVDGKLVWAEGEHRRPKNFQSKLNWRGRQRYDSGRVRRHAALAYSPRRPALFCTACWTTARRKPSWQNSENTQPERDASTSRSLRMWIGALDRRPSWVSIWLLRRHEGPQFPELAAPPPSAIPMPVLGRIG